jgi:peptide chain release factor
MCVGQTIYAVVVLAFPVSEKKAKALRERLTALACSEADIDERFIRRSGVELVHRPTGVRVRSSGRGCQSLNRFLARRLLADELEARLQNKTRHLIKAEKIRQEKGKNKRPTMSDQVAQFMLRPLPEADQRLGSREIEKRLSQLKQINEVENG